MTPFLQHIIDGIPDDQVSNLNNWCFVFPSKRAGLYFEELLQKRFEGKTFWCPSILSIEDFVFECSGDQPADEISLIFQLFETYQSLEKGLEFEKFYSWGQVLISDFEEIDRNLVDAGKLYKGLASSVEIDKVFGENEELKEAYQKFIELFTSDVKTELVSRFVKNWNKVYEAYLHFNEKMESTGSFHAGKIFKNLASKDPLKDDVYPFKRIIFAGFNALARSEEEIIVNTLKSGIGEIYWDCDQLYMRDESEEAGLFLRQYKKKWNYEGVHWIETNFVDDEKNVWSIGCPQLVAQAKVTSKIVKDNALEQTPTDTAIVLGDELLMMPVLNALDVPAINVTMGYPIKNTSIYHFVIEIIRMHSEARKHKDYILFESGRVLAILKNPLVSPVFSSLTTIIASEIRKMKRKWMRASELEDLCEDSWLKLVFGESTDYEDLLTRIESFLVQLFYHLKSDSENTRDETSKEIIYYGVKHLVRFKENLKKQSFDPGLSFLARLFSETFRSIKIPFSGEPLQGMQVMGFLESRALDFKNVILLGVNENKLPSSGSGNTYIPYVARKAFGLSTFEEHQAIYAYHFKRILQRAKNVWMLYDTEVAVDGSGEKSRFILQLLNTAKKENKFSIREKTVNVPYESNSVIHTVTVEKTPSIIKALSKYVIKDDDAKWMSPTRLVTYIDCKLQFYLKYVAKVPELDPTLDQIDPRVFGNIVHKTMDLAYRPLKGKELTEDMLKDIETRIDALVEEAMLAESVIHESYTLHGKDVLLRSVICKLIVRILQEDKKMLPFTIEGIEEKVTKRFTLSDGREVLLGGTVDRIETENDGSLTIIDYKSGKVDMVSPTHTKLTDPAKYLSVYFSDGKYKSGFQTYYYAMLLKETKNTPIKGAVYELKRLNKGKRYLRNQKPIEPAIFDAYQLMLRQLIEEILDPEVPFNQTEELKKCTWCPYTTICQR